MNLIRFTGCAGQTGSVLPTAPRFVEKTASNVSLTSSRCEHSLSELVRPTLLFERKL